MELILASKSRDRKQLFESARLPVKIYPSNFNEDSIVESNPYERVKKIAIAKARTTREKMKNDGYDFRECIIIAADTMVLFQNELIGKAKSFEDAQAIFRKLSGKSHELITGVAIIKCSSDQERVFHEISEVFYQVLTEEEIQSYLTLTKEYQGRAGAYSLRERASLFIKRIEGCPTNVLGLPMARIRETLKEMGVNLLNIKE